MIRRQKLENLIYRSREIHQWIVEETIPLTTQFDAF